MSRQKCMSFPKCSSLEVKNVTHFKLCYQIERSLTMTSNKQNVENKAFNVGFTLLKIKLLEKIALKIKITETKINDQFYKRSAESLQLPNAD